MRIVGGGVYNQDWNSGFMEHFWGVEGWRLLLGIPPECPCWDICCPVTSLGGDQRRGIGGQSRSGPRLFLLNIVHSHRDGKHER